MTDLGPEGLLQLSGTLALTPIDGVRHDVDAGTAALMGGLQDGLRAMLSTATKQTGTMTGLPMAPYAPGELELSAKWVRDLMAAGRSLSDLGPGAEGYYGYQLLSPLLRGDGYDAAFLSTIGADMIDFEMEQGKGSALWTEKPFDLREGGGIPPLRDWTEGLNRDRAGDDPDNHQWRLLGYDPVNALMDTLQHNGEATRDLLTRGGRVDGEWPRLDYLLTDRTWNAGYDLPVGSSYADGLLESYGDPSTSTDDALGKFGIALEQATTGDIGHEERRLVEAIIYEFNTDEQGAGFLNGESPDNGKAGTFAETDLIDPRLRGSMAKILSEYIGEVGNNLFRDKVPMLQDGTIGYEPRSSEQSLGVNRSHLIHVLADIGKDETARTTVAGAEMLHASTRYAEIYADDSISDAVKNSNLRDISRTYGTVVGTLDFGAGEAKETTIQKTAHSYNLVGILAETGLSAVPVVGDFANAVSSSGLEEHEEEAKVHNQRLATTEVAALLGSGRHTAELLAEAALYHSGELENLPARLLEDGQLKPMTTWNEIDFNAWENYSEVAAEGGPVRDVLGAAAENYGNAHIWAKETLAGRER